jgi:hypothetical protein
MWFSVDVPTAVFVGLWHKKFHCETQEWKCHNSVLLALWIKVLLVLEHYITISDVTVLTGIQGEFFGGGGMATQKKLTSLYHRGLTAFPSNISS